MFLNKCVFTVVLNLFELVAHLFGLKTLAAYLCLIKTEILVLMVINDEKSIVVFTCFLVDFKTSKAHLCVAEHRLRSKALHNNLPWNFFRCAANVFKYPRKHVFKQKPWSAVEHSAHDWKVVGSIPVQC